jgi:hypothetical protein
LAALAGALLLAGCGGQSTLGKKALQQEAAGLQSLAAEGDVLAEDAARGRSTSTFVRIHGAELGKAAGASAATLVKDRAANARALGALAGRVENELDKLAHSGSDRTAQRRIAAELERAVAEASTLGERL